MSQFMLSILDRIQDDAVDEMKLLDVFVDEGLIVL